MAKRSKEEKKRKKKDKETHKKINAALEAIRKDAARERRKSLREIGRHSYADHDHEEGEVI